MAESGETPGFVAGAVISQNPPEGAERILEDDIVPVDRLVPGIDATIAAEIMTGLAVKMEERPQTAKKYLDLLTGERQVRKAEPEPAKQVAAPVQAMPEAAVPKNPEKAINAPEDAFGAVDAPQKPKKKPGIIVWAALVAAVVILVGYYGLFDQRATKVLSGHTRSAQSVSFSPDGRTLASGSFDNTIRLWDVVSGKELQQLSGHTGSVQAVSFSPDGRTLASGSLDKTIRLWNVVSGKELSKLAGHTSSVWSVAFSPDGRTLARGSDDNQIRLWDVSDSKKR